ncbi:bZIP transcription factor 1-A-like isoform X1 [Zingiber officinale]|uniref:bZIP transcription factor 1-A-like isoform X1 n=1 Tax=Zingiber officinale TaxID=94328 RepID=UPI001C4BD65B|nr:bZIP transcription factor 1-A-like isoform X1 [Zingiber officinale]XP_042391224.1 bZIP transcription factor 1-A-like isoform X1 [Zingiber officinale]XP_042391225.1 bZIP transcription factor 1-A-like isoform X1 [Zingiber officinale]
MASDKADSSAKAPKTVAAQEQPPMASSVVAPSVYPDWSGYQSYPPIPPHGLFHSPAGSSPYAHPYMWGVQHLMPPYGSLPPYGSPPPPYVMYPPRGLYAHPSIPPGSYPFGSYAMTNPSINAGTSGTPLGGMEMDDKPSKRNKRDLMNCSGSSNILPGKDNTGPYKASGTSTTEVSQSGNSASDSSSKESDANSESGSLPKSSGHESFDASSLAMTNRGMEMIPIPTASTPGGVGCATTNLNMGMEYWGTPSLASPIPTMQGKMAVNKIGAGLPGSSEHWDERERKRQRRKQSNREAARRSRMRKQTEYEELAHRAENLKEENTSLRIELDNVKSEYQQLISKYNSLKEKLEVQKEIKEPDTERNEQ